MAGAFALAALRRNNLMLPGKLNLGNAIDNRAPHNNANNATIQTAVKEKGNPLPATAARKAGPE